MYFGYHGNQIHCHGNRSHAWLIFADFSRFRDIYPCQDISDILLCFLRPVAMETKCHAWLISTEKVVIGVAKGNPSGDLAIACNCTYSSYYYYSYYSYSSSHFFVQSFFLRPLRGSSWYFIIRRDPKSTCKNKVFRAWKLVVSMETWKLRFSEHKFQLPCTGIVSNKFQYKVSKW